MDSCWKSVEEGNRQSPITMDKYSVLMNMTCSEKLSRIILTHNIKLKMLKSDVKKENIDGYFIHTGNKVCTDSSANALLRNYDLEYKLLDEKGAFVSSKIFRKEDCR